MNLIVVYGFVMDEKLRREARRTHVHVNGAWITVREWNRALTVEREVAERDAKTELAEPQPS